jgi:hypothetical protein
VRSSTVQQAAFAFAVAACSCKGNLSTSGAAATIRRAQAFNEPKTVFFQNGKDLTLYPFAPEYPALRTLGLIEILGAPKVDGVFFKGLEVALTSAGKRESTNWKREDSGRATSWTVPIARRQLREILGVRALPDGTSEVEFMWSWAPNAVGVAIGNEADAAAVFREESSKKAEQAYRDQFDHNPVDPLVRVILICSPFWRVRRRSTGRGS